MTTTLIDNLILELDLRISMPSVCSVVGHLIRVTVRPSANTDARTRTGPIAAPGPRKRSTISACV